MENIDHKSNRPSEDELDRILDAALSKYASAEPRAGLESRILGNLTSIYIPAVQSAWWPWGLGAALATVVVALVIGMRSTKPDSQDARRQTHAQARSSEAGSHKLGLGVQVPERQVPIDISRASAITIRRKPRAPTNPKLDQFPSPHPLSEQEQMLALYVAQFQNEAVIVARVRTQALQLEREEAMRETEQDRNQGPQAR